MTFADVIGLTGVMLYQVAYGGVQLGKFNQSNFIYLTLNLLAPCCVIFSLISEFNLASFVAQIFWSVITFVGIVRECRVRRRIRVSMKQETILKENLNDG